MSNLRFIGLDESCHPTSRFCESAAKRWRGGNLRRSWPPVPAGAHPIHADIATTHAFNGLPPVIDLTASHHRVPPI